MMTVRVDIGVGALGGGRGLGVDYPLGWVISHVDHPGSPG